MSAPVLFSVIVVLISPAIGSFLNVLIDRLPRGENPVWPGSHCRDCGVPLRARDLVPVLSYVLSRGCCRHCGAAIAPWHLYVELAATGVAVLAVLWGGGTLVIGLSALVLWILLALIVCDLIWLRLPNVLTAGLAGCAVALSLTGLALPGGIAQAGIGAVIGAGSFWGLRWGYHQLRGREGLGLGDVKLMAGLGALVGPWLLPHMILLAASGALLVAMIQHLTGRQTMQGSRPLPFGAALALAGAIVWGVFRLPV